MLIYTLVILWLLLFCFQLVVGVMYNILVDTVKSLKAKKKVQWTVVVFLFAVMFLAAFECLKYTLALLVH